MDAASLPRLRDASMPRPPDGLGTGAVLAVLVHLLLVAALAFSVNWRVHEPESVTAELWSAVPQMAAARETRPPPEPAPALAQSRSPAPVPHVAPEPARAADAQIAVEKARREEAQRARDERDKTLAEAARRERAAQEAEERRKKELAEQARKGETALALQREAYLKRMQGQANATGETESTGTAARSSGPSASYAGRIRARIRPNIVFTDSVSGNPLATVEVRCAPDGTIVSRKLIQGSTQPAWDEAVLRAIDKTEVLPRDTDGRVPPVFEIGFRPRD
ncbi:MAG TPA: TonB C-terminal domain-containing protein [Caldimonas sp.]